MCFDHIYSPLPPPTASARYSYMSASHHHALFLYILFFYTPLSRINAASMYMGMEHALEHNLTAATPTKKNDYASQSSHQLAIVPQLGVGIVIPSLV